ncbi:MAG: ankyrin repeat domain-containing protein, partial [Promethearchaeia archaeon]
MLMRDIASFSEDPLSEQRDRHGNTAVIIAAQQGLLKITKLLVAASCNVNAQNKKGDTALHYAGLYGFHSLMDYLKRKGADDSIHNHAGKTCYQIEATLPS